MKDTVISSASEDTVSSPAFLGLGKQVLPLSVHMLLPETTGKPLSEGSHWNHCPTSSLHSDVSFFFYKQKNKTLTRPLGKGELLIIIAVLAVAIRRVGSNSAANLSKKT